MSKKAGNVNSQVAVGLASHLIGQEDGVRFVNQSQNETNAIPNSYNTQSRKISKKNSKKTSKVWQRDKYSSVGKDQGLVLWLSTTETASDRFIDALLTFRSWQVCWDFPWRVRHTRSYLEQWNEVRKNLGLLCDDLNHNFTTFVYVR